MPGSAEPTVELFFDPVCPWTWLASRWLVDVGGQTGIEPRWHALSLGLLSTGELEVTSKTPNHLRPLLPVSTQALRIVEHLAAEDRNADIGRFYTAFGTALHVDEAEPGPALIRALQDAGLGDVSAGDDPALDAAVRASHDRAQSLLAGETGSPVLSIDGNAIFGPIVSPAPTGTEALELWETVRRLVSMPAFFELKRNRSGPPQMA